MTRKWYMYLLGLSAALMVTTTFAKDDTPGRLGYRRVQESDETIVALLAQRIARGLQTNDPYLYLSFVTENLPKLSSQSKAIDYDLTLGDSKLRLRFVKNGERWNLINAAEFATMAKSAYAKLGKVSTGVALLQTATSAENDKTFINRELAPEHQISMLSRRVTTGKLQRQLFSLPAGSALFAKLQQFDTAPYFQASYVQLVTDPAWNRIVYGDYQKWIKAYDGAESGTPLNRPQSLVVDPQGVVYVADMGNSRILALKLTGTTNDLKLSPLGEIGKKTLSQPTELAWDDRGTVFDSSDDLLWVIDREENTLYAFRTAVTASGPVLKYNAESFSDLTALAVGRFDGRSDGNIYVADAGTRKIHRLYFNGAQLISVGSYQGEAEMVPSALATDHWGNIYLSDEAHRKIAKFSPALEPLAELRSDDPNFQPRRFQPLFGSVSTSSNQKIWSGYDQAFLLEKWTEHSGARRYELGIDFHLTDLRLTDDLSTLSLAGKLTDPGQVKIELVPAKVNAPIAGLANHWHNSGTVQFNWNRRLSNGGMIAPGYYKLQLTLRSTYEKPDIVSQSLSFYLPLYYYDDCGVVGHDSHLIRGTRLTTPEQTIVTDAEEVVYRFKNLNPTVTYEVKASYFSAEGQVEQALYAEQDLIHPATRISQAVTQTEWMTIPAQAIADHTLDLRFVKKGGNGNASVAEIWLREANYDPNHPPALETTSESVPQTFALQQNYPNPFNPSTTIEFGIPENHRGYVSLRIYNMLGEVVRELVAGELAPGNYRQIWDGLDNAGRRLASGLYMYQLRAGSFSATRKLVLMK